MPREFEFDSRDQHERFSFSISVPPRYFDKHKTHVRSANTFLDG